MTQEKNGQTREARPAGTSDISMDVRREEGPRRVEWEKATILNGMSEQVVYQDAEMRIVWANRAAAESRRLGP